MLQSPHQLISSPLTEVWVAIDTETTGLDPERDQIIEVGAVKFRGDEVLDVFQSFVNPGRRLSSFIRKFTGIAQKDVDRAPPFSKVARDLLPFIGVSPVVGHNVGFDLGFLRSHGLPITNALSDTYDLAQVFLPSASEYSLGGLARNLDIPVIRAHRAIDDAKTTRSVFVRLLEIADRTDLDTLRQMESIASKSPSSALTYPLRQMVGNGTVNRAQLSLDEPAIDLRELAAMRRLQATPAPRRAGGFDLADLKDRLRHPQSLRTNEDAEPIDVDEALTLLAEDGPIALALSGFEERTEQIEMARAVTEAINDGQRLVVEAGTGVGKSLAYLLPAVLHAVRNNKRVVVSTNTINLQEQLMTKDIPTLIEALSGVPGFSTDEFKYALLKGRANYLCLKRWTHLKNGDSVSDEDARLLSKVLLWLDETSTGDRSELNIGSRNFSSWNRMSAQGALDCNGYNGACFLRASRARAAASYLVVVNHALLLTDLIMGGTLIPEYDVLIIDEAHHLESEATKHLGFEVSQGGIAEHLQMLTGDRGLVNRAKTVLQRASAPTEKRESLDQVGQKMTSLLPTLRESMAGYFGVLNGAIQGASDGQQMRVTKGVRRQPQWSTAETVWENVNGNLADLQSNLSDVSTALDGLDAADVVDHEGLLLEVANSAQTNAEIRRNLEEFAVTPKDDGIYWVDRSPRGGDLSLSAAPLHVGDQLESLLYSQKRTVVMTSATLSTNGTFDHIRERTGFADSEDLLLGSPFDYPNSTLLCVPTDMPEPSGPGYIESAGQAIVDAAVAAGGRTMALFTSYASLRDTARAIGTSMQAAGLELLVQGSDGSPYQIVRRFLDNPKSVILGTSSFWEGVDLAGDSLQVLVVMRLPFNVPTEPVFEARSELYDNSFMQYAVPQAILRLRQGFGRLIRTKNDRGVAIILDQRIVSRRYGKLFVRSLPPASRKTCKLDEVGDEVGQWLHK